MIAFNSEKIKKKLEKKIEHPYLEQYIKKPFIDIYKIKTLLTIFDEVKIQKQHQNDYIISVMLVQMALDTHELVTNESKSLADDIERQLSVLAGDYYSGLYYKTLAEIDENQLVRVLANAIKVINEHKMILYKDEIKDWAQLMNVLEKIESTLMTNVAELYQLSAVNNEYIKNFLLVNRLYNEKEAIQCYSFSYIQHYVEQNIIDQCGSSVMFCIEQEIERRQEQMKLLQTESSFSFGKLNNSLFNKKMLSAVEEG